MKNEKLVFQSGNEVGTEVKCFNCGKPFAESAAEGGLSNGSVVCTECNGRLAWIVEEEEK